MWPFKKRKFASRFARIMASSMSVGAALAAKNLADEWEHGRLERGEYVAMLFPTVGAAELAQRFFRNLSTAPLKNLEFDDMPVEAEQNLENTLLTDDDPGYGNMIPAPIKGYFILVTTLFHALQAEMRINPDTRKAIGVPHHVLMKKYQYQLIGGDLTALTLIELVQQNRKQIAKVIKDNPDNGPTIAYSYQIIQFLLTMSVKSPDDIDTLEKMVFLPFWDTMMGLLNNFRTALNDSSITTLSDLTVTINEAPLATPKPDWKMRDWINMRL